MAKFEAVPIGIRIEAEEEFDNTAVRCKYVTGAEAFSREAVVTFFGDEVGGVAEIKKLAAFLLEFVDAVQAEQARQK